MVNKIDLLSDGDFKELILKSSNVSDVLKELGYSVIGNSWAYKIIKDRMKKLDITFGSKFTYEQRNYAYKLIPLSDILIEHSDYNRTKLKERLIKEGLKEYKCECCGISKWQNKYISLQLHHINGVHDDNRIENLQLLCPNCHSQTDNFGTKGGRIITKMAEALPLEDKKKILEKVREVGIVQARKELTYRNSLINSIVKNNKDIIIMITPNSEEKEFTNMTEASRYLYSKYNIGSNPESNRSGISKVCNGKQDSIQGFKFKRKSVV